jgi:hypothetical protein
MLTVYDIMNDGYARHYEGLECDFIRNPLNLARPSNALTRIRGGCPSSGRSLKILSLDDLNCPEDLC